MALKNRLRINGSTTFAGICFCHASLNTLPNEIAMRIYKKVHIGPKSHEGGAHVGLIYFEYQSYVLFMM